MRIYDSGGMTDPEASDDPGDIEFDGSTRRVTEPRTPVSGKQRHSFAQISDNDEPEPNPKYSPASDLPSSTLVLGIRFSEALTTISITCHKEFGEGMEKAYNASKVLRRLLDIDSTCGPSCPPPVPAIHAGQPARISFQIPAPGASSSERKTIASSTSVFQNPLEKPTTASTTNPTNLNPLHSPALSTRRSSPPANSAEKANQEPTTTANIEESTSEKPAPNTRCLIDAVEKVVQCARVLDHNNQSRTKREVELQTETTALRQITKSLGVSLRDTKTKCEKLECEMMSLAEEVRALKRDLEAVRGQQELLREFVVQMIAVLLNKTCTTGSV
ncbi:hypothetical protein BJY00DRAFT_318913 [Aspergillus carlsbadensis]|nr:hypothetical protein BJY00DRAFT_318913 [Aspergillus carlsbadensis]